MKILGTSYEPLKIGAQDYMTLLPDWHTMPFVVP